MKRKINHIIFLPLFVFFIFGDCSKSNNSNPSPTPVPVPASNDVEMWLTKPDQSVLLQKQAAVLSFVSTANSFPNIDVDSATTYQTIDGFGYTLTGGSAYLINQMDAASRSSLLNELFGNAANSIGVSYLRVSIGASDLNNSVFSYDDMPAGQTDISLSNFSLSQDTLDLIPVLKQILAINPNIKILGSPWSPPVWMKDNGSTIGGNLQAMYYGVYANYFVKYIQQMQLKGIPVNAITVQNEPQNPGNNPSLLMSATQQARIITWVLWFILHRDGINRNTF